jgi:hypothetical protein
MKLDGIVYQRWNSSKLTRPSLQRERTQEQATVKPSDSWQSKKHKQNAKTDCGCSLVEIGLREALERGGDAEIASRDACAARPEKSTVSETFQMQREGQMNAPLYCSRMPSDSSKHTCNSHARDVRAADRSQELEGKEDKKRKQTLKKAIM